MYPSEYAYRNDSVIRTENASANCMRYPSSLQAGVFTEVYTHCNGSKLKLTDSNFGSEQYQRMHYYVWIAERAGELLFIFPTRVSLTTITLHYYSGSLRGLPRLRFYAVPDDFDVWDAPITSYPSIDVASASPGGELAGHRNISINVNFHTRRVLMYKYVSGFGFAVSEVEFFECNGTK